MMGLEHNSQNHAQGRTNISFDTMLCTLYPDNREKQLFLDGRIALLASKRGFWDGSVPQNLLTGQGVVNTFLQKLTHDYGAAEITKLYQNGARYLLEGALSDDAATINNALYNMAKALGNCPTPVNDLLERTGLQLVLKRNGEIDTTLQTLLDRQAFENYILLKKIELPTKESIEALQGLVNAVFMKNAEINRRNIVKIKGTRQRLPSKTRNIEHAFDKVTEDMRKAFAKLCCKTDKEGAPIQDGNENYELDPEKYRMITEYYMKFHGIFSDREKAIAEHMDFIQKCVPESFICEHFDSPKIAPLIDFPSQEWRLREALSKVPDDQIQALSDTLVKEFRDTVVRTERECNGAQRNLTKLMTSPFSLTDRTNKRHSYNRTNIPRGKSPSTLRQRRNSI